MISWRWISSHVDGRIWGSVVDTQGRTEADVKAMIGKARVAFLQLKNIWNYYVISLKNKIKIFNTNVKAVFLYGAETWRTTVTNRDLCQQLLKKNCCCCCLVA